MYFGDSVSSPFSSRQTKSTQLDEQDLACFDRIPKKTMTCLGGIGEHAQDTAIAFAYIDISIRRQSNGVRLRFAFQTKRPFPSSLRFVREPTIAYRSIRCIRMNPPQPIAGRKAEPRLTRGKTERVSQELDTKAIQPKSFRESNQKKS